jgi:hypothetical protein
MLYLIPLFIGIFLNSISSVYVRHRAETLLKNPYLPLPDLIHIYFPKINTFIPDYLLILFISMSAYYYNSLIEIDKNILCIGICTIIRSISINLTIMPSCMSKPTNKLNIYTKYFVSTHDLMFSGHTLFFIGIGNMLDNYLIKIIGPFTLVVSRQHYTIDVCVSGLVYYNILSKL